MHLINWAEAKKAMEAGEGIARKVWEQESENTISFIFIRPADALQATTLMQFRSIPEKIKTVLRRKQLVDEGVVAFTAYICAVRTNLKARPDLSLCFENVYEPTPEDVSANDWYIL